MKDSNPKILSTIPHSFTKEKRSKKEKVMVMMINEIDIQV